MMGQASKNSTLSDHGQSPSDVQNICMGNLNYNLTQSYLNHFSTKLSQRL